LYVKRHADKLNVGDIFLRVLKCFSCLSEGREKERKKERKKEFECIGVFIFSEIFSTSVNPPLPPSSFFGSFLVFVR
jgi:hypothetical protein